MKNKTHSRNAPPAGFTLVEIMIVVAIIGLLASIAIPNYRQAHLQADRTACIVNLRQIDGAVQTWATENKRDAEQPVTYTDIQVYLRNPVVCPAGGTSFDDSYTLTTAAAPPACLRQPATHKLPW